MTLKVDLPQQSLDRLVAVVRANYTPDSPTHDHMHLRRVASLATQLCAAEGGDQSIGFCAAWVHDLHREARPGGAFFVTPEAMDERATRYLHEAGLPAEVHPAILEAVHYTDRFSFSDRPTYEASVEARCVRDADNLDALGAIGIARAFAFGGSHDIPLYRDDVPVASDGFVQNRKPASTIHHFYEKLLRLSLDLETATAKRLAVRRQRYLAGFVEQFMDEWYEDLGRVAPEQHPNST